MTTTRKTVAPNHAKLLGREVVATFGAGRRVRGRICDTTVTDAGTTCVALEVHEMADTDCDGVWTPLFWMV